MAHTHIEVFLFDLNTQHIQAKERRDTSRGSEQLFYMRINTKVVMSAAWMIPLLSQAINYQRHQCSNPVPAHQGTKYYKFAIIFIIPIPFKGLRETPRWPRLLTDIISYFYLFCQLLSLDSFCVRDFLYN
jgi:hypothetical protein